MDLFELSRRLKPIVLGWLEDGALGVVPGPHALDPAAGPHTGTLVHELAGVGGLGVQHTVSGLTPGQVLRATGATTAAFGAIQASDLPGAFSGFANPSASVGLSAVNGSATTAMRSDAAPAIDQSISPNWTGYHAFLANYTNFSSATSERPLLDITNSNADQFSGYIRFLKNSASPADDDRLGEIHFDGKTSTAAVKTYARIIARALDVTNGDTGGGIAIYTVIDDVECEMINVTGYNGSVGQGYIRLNGSENDVDTIIKSAIGDALLIQGSDGTVNVWNVGGGGEALAVRDDINGNIGIELVNAHATGTLTTANFRVKNVSGVGPTYSFNFGITGLNYTPLGTLDLANRGVIQTGSGVVNGLLIRTLGDYPVVIGVDTNTMALEATSDYVNLFDVMHVLASGSVGIGKIPTSPFHVLGNVSSADVMTAEWSSSSTSLPATYGGLNLYNTDNTNNNYATLYFSTKNVSGVQVFAARIQAVFTDHTAGSHAADLVFSTAQSGTTTEKMRIRSNGQIGIGTASPVTSALLDLTSTTGALLVPRMTTTQRNALTAANGMIIYNTTTAAFNFYENGAWVTGSGLI